MITRRSFVKMLAAVGSALLRPLDRLAPYAAPAQAQAAAEGELYEGFILLPAGAPTPAFVKNPARGIPRMCGVGVPEDGLVPTTRCLAFQTVEDLGKATHFPLYTLQGLPAPLRLGAISSTEHWDGAVYDATVSYTEYDPEEGYWRTRAQITAFPDFPRPFPIWSPDPLRTDQPFVDLERVNYLPTPGVRVPSRRGYVWYWIQDNLLYCLNVDAGPSVSGVLPSWAAQGPSVFTRSLVRLARA